jgi:hypothetical protein
MPIAMLADMLDRSQARMSRASECSGPSFGRAPWLAGRGGPFHFHNPATTDDDLPDLLKNSKTDTIVKDEAGALISINGHQRAMDDLETHMGCDRLVTDPDASWTRGSVHNAGYATCRARTAPTPPGLDARVRHHPPPVMVEWLGKRRLVSIHSVGWCQKGHR